MALLLPTITFLFLALAFLGRERNTEPGIVRLFNSIIIAAIGCGFLMHLSAEIFGPFNAINRISLLSVWFIALVFSVYFGFTTGSLRLVWDRVRNIRIQYEWLDWFFILSIIGILLTLLILAWFSPPNNVDSLLYHMARVVHWAQNGSIDHYATAYNHQNFMPPWAETAILHLRVLWGNDRPANLIQWISLVGSVVGVVAIAKLLGAGRKSQFLAAAFALSIPMGILQATSTQNDLVVTFWLVSLAFFVVLNKHRALTLFDLIILGIVLGLGMLTKATFYIYALPVLVWFFVPRLKEIGFVRWLGQGAGIFLIAALINSGFWIRNLRTYEHIFGPASYVQRGLEFSPLAERDSSDAASDDGSEMEANNPAFILETVGDFVVSGTMRVPQMMAKNAVTPSSAINTLILRVATTLPSVFGQDFQESQSIQAWNHEDTAGNPLHLLFVLVSAITLVVFNLRNRLRSALFYGIACFSGYALIAIVLSNGPTLDGLRFQLPFFVLWAPIVGVVFSAIGRPFLTRGATGLFLLASIPWLLLNNTRPIIGLPPWPTRTESVFSVGQDVLMYSAAPGYRQPYSELSSALEELNCNKVGLRLDSHDLEYLLWWELEAPQSGVELKAVDSISSLKRYLDRDFTPCAIICTTCGGRVELDGLQRMGEFGNVVLFTRQGYE
jgi:hypothetical protein